jgi:hypothetical protein
MSDTMEDAILRMDPEEISEAEKICAVCKEVS